MYEMMVVLGSMATMWGFAAWLACAVFAGHVAAEKMRCGGCWFVWGLLFGPISLIAAVGLPAREVSEEERTRRSRLFSYEGGILIMALLGITAYVALR